MMQFSAVQRLKILKIAAEICGERGYRDGSSEQLVKVYRELCEAVTTFPGALVADAAWVEKLEAIEAHFASATKAAEKIGCARPVFWRMKQMSAPSPTYEAQVDRLYAQVVGRAN